MALIVDATFKLGLNQAMARCSSSTGTARTKESGRGVRCEPPTEIQSSLVVVWRWRTSGRTNKKARTRTLFWGTRFGNSEDPRDHERRKLKVNPSQRTVARSRSRAFIFLSLSRSLPGRHSLSNSRACPIRVRFNNFVLSGSCVKRNT
jgi:hypothetical protein